MTPLVAYLLLFVAVGAGFILVHLVAGKFLRPSKMDAEKGTIYECGEPTIGSAWVQFDLRFYVVALLFVIFDVEVAFFFPWAEVFGHANALASVRRLDDAAAYRTVGEEALLFTPPYDETGRAGLERLARTTPEDVARLHELREWAKTVPVDLSATVGAAAGAAGQQQVQQRLDALRSEKNLLEDVEKNALNAVGEGRTFAWLAFGEILLFFGVLLVGFAYLWKRGDLAWVRSVAAERLASLPPPEPPPPAPAPAPRPLAEVGAPH